MGVKVRLEGETWTPAEPGAAHARPQLRVEPGTQCARRDQQYFVVAALQIGLFGVIGELGAGRVVEQDMGDAHADQLWSTGP